VSTSPDGIYDIESPSNGLAPVMQIPMQKHKKYKKSQMTPFKSNNSTIVDTNDSEVDKIKIKIRKNNYKKSQ
jgi:hypothetical protein